MCDFPNSGEQKKRAKKEEIDMGKVLENQGYKKLNISLDKIKEISVTPKVKDGKLIFNRENKNHRYIIEDD